MEEIDNNYLKKDASAIYRLIGKHIFVLIIMIISYVVTYCFNVYLARLLSPKDYGNISVALQLLVFFVPFALLGTEISVLRYIPKYLRAYDLQKASGFLQWIVKVFFLGALFIFFAGILFNTAMHILGKYYPFAREASHIIFFSFWLIPLYAFVVLAANLLQALRSYYFSAAFSGFVLYAIMSLLIFIFVSLMDLSQIRFKDVKYVVIICIGSSYVLVAGLEVAVLLKKLPREIYQIKAVFEKSLWLKSSLHMMLSTIIFAGLSAIDIFMLDLIAKNQAVVGHFAAIFTIASSLMIFSGAVDMIVNPIISPSVSSGDTSHLQTTLHLLNIIKVILIGCIFTLLVIFGKNLLSHFGNDFVDSYPSLLIILAGFVWEIFYHSSGPLLLYSNRERLSFVISLSQLIFIIVLDIPMIHYFGLKGAVSVLSLSIIISSLVRTYFCHKYLKIRVFFLF